MTLSENLIYLEENIKQLKDELVYRGVKLNNPEKLKLRLELNAINSKIDFWREWLRA